ncbi:hypothetical protein ACIO1C_29780 [Streptomyces sp. NPDC087420]
MKQERVQRPMRAASTKRTQQEREDGERGRQEVREDVRRVWFGEDA